MILSADNPEIPVSLREALYERLRLQKRFEMDQDNYFVFERDLNIKIKDIEKRLTRLDEELYDFLDIFSSQLQDVAEDDLDRPFQEKRNRREYNALFVEWKGLIEDLQKSESIYHQKCVKLKQAIAAYNDKNIYDLEDEYVLGVKDVADLVDYVAQIIPADECELAGKKSTRVSKKLGIVDVIKSIFNSN